MRANIIFIMADDMGYADLGCTGARSDKPISPNLDRLAASGMLCTNGYSNSPVCSPTRVALATGRWQYRLRVGGEEPMRGSSRGDKVLGLPSDHPTVPSLLAQAGYRTALIGKWHLGYPPEFGPLKSGYQEFYGILSGAVDYFSHEDRRGVRDLWTGSEPAAQGGYLTDLISTQAVEFISQQSADRPFLLNVHYTAPHWPWETRSDEEESRRIGTEIYHLDGGSRATYEQMIREMDEGIGDIVSALEEKGLDKDTLIIFTSDNGGERYSDTWPFIGQKMDLLEGGIRVPLLLHWPRRIKAGSVSHTPSQTMDWSATMLAIAGVHAHPDYPLDGIDMSSLFDSHDWNPERDLYWRMKHRGQRALRRGRWKYLRMDGVDYLFDLSRDQRERANLAQIERGRLGEMTAAWEDWNRTIPDIPEAASVSLVYSSEQLPIPTH
jgi:arylsulfatase A-like enzyme